ncbi:MAG: DUF4038 domain-containing protein [Planctomycetes bacterium]|nr:DUF4038 domain-containing protein [Planctomycetota bacterium]
MSPSAAAFARASAVVAVLVLALSLPSFARPAPPRVAFTASAERVEAYDFLEVTVRVDAPRAGNPFMEASVRGSFGLEGSTPLEVDGFCDSRDGTVHRIRFLPAKPGRYTYRVEYRDGDSGEEVARHWGTFEAVSSKRRGLVRVDRDHPWHFVWEGTGERYFWNGTTAYWLLGWDDATIASILERLARLKVNRVRAALNGHVKDGRDWFENVYPTEKFQFRLNPWVAARPGDWRDPGFDVTRFELEHWRKCERMLRAARELDIVVSLIFYVDGNKPGMDPFGKAGMGGEDERRYYRYAAARLAAFSNVLWDVSNEYRHFRTDEWANAMGTYLKERDPYDHLTSTHGHGDFRFMTSPWADFAMYQSWDEAGGYRFMLSNRERQAKTGRIIPQVNEEYGYEDHYPVGWGGNRKTPARSADNRRRLAWEISMAGCYQTTGERADRGTGWGPDSGGGWLNGRGDETMTMLVGYKHMLDFFAWFRWWRLEPRPDLVVEGDLLCLAEPGKHYALYFPKGGKAALRLEPGRYDGTWYNPRTGESQHGGLLEGSERTPVSVSEGAEDWALAVHRVEAAGEAKTAAAPAPAAPAPAGGPAPPAGGATPLSLHPESPRYFLFRGKPAVLVTSGEHYGAVLNLDFDYRPYLDELRSRGFNLTRTFSGTYREVPGSFGIQGNTLAPHPGRYTCPWARTLEPGGFDGEGKLDLERWDEAYFLRLKDFVGEASQRGIVVELVLFCPMYEDVLWKACPMSAENNVNGIGAIPREEAFTLKHPDLLEVQLAFTRRVVGELNGFDNVYFEVCNEPYFGGVTLEWQHRIAEAIAETEKGLPARHLIAQNIANGHAKVQDPHPAVSVFNFHYAYPPRAVEENWAFARPIAFDETGFRGSEDLPYRTEAWDFLLAGGAVYSNLDYSFTPEHEAGTAVPSAPGGGGPALRAQLAVLKRFVEGFDFVAMAPDRSLVAGGVPPGFLARALSRPGKEHAVYVHRQRGAGPFSVRWTGLVEPLHTETYTFHTLSNDGVRLWVDGRLLVDDWTDHADKEGSGAIALEARKRYELKLEHFQAGGTAAARLSWSSPSQRKEVVPAARLFLPGGAGGGLKAQYFAGKSFEDLKLERTDPQVDFEWKAGASPFQAPPGPSRLSLVLELPAGSYRAEWVGPLTGAVEKQEAFEHAGGRRTLESPEVGEDIALRIVSAGR